MCKKCWLLHSPNSLGWLHDRSLLSNSIEEPCKLLQLPIAPKGQYSSWGSVRDGNPGHNPYASSMLLLELCCNRAACHSKIWQALDQSAPVHLALPCYIFAGCET
ncbi:hypothetical protein KIL84_003231 [Mauremys mutica]|uniref:Uncharacterized protein n=1 Tax=Mauremys mutica TaxID=74926 RepID=A0A9D3WW33_9SAUR|nr:hypothetical protein KIL84_003231 [Mauremys mutica]